MGSVKSSPASGPVSFAAAPSVTLTAGALSSGRHPLGVSVLERLLAKLGQKFSRALPSGATNNSGKLDFVDLLHCHRRSRTRAVPLDVPPSQRWGWLGRQQTRRQLKL